MNIHQTVFVQSPEHTCRQGGAAPTPINNASAFLVSCRRPSEILLQVQECQTQLQNQVSVEPVASVTFTKPIHKSCLSSQEPTNTTYFPNIKCMKAIVI
jgi:hypothetical protein